MNVFFRLSDVSYLELYRLTQVRVHVDVCACLVSSGLFHRGQSC